MVLRRYGEFESGAGLGHFYFQTIYSKAIEATVDPDGRLETAVPLRIKRRTKVILTIAVDDEEDVNG